MTQARIQALVKHLDPRFEKLVGGTPEDRAAIWGQAEQESNANPAAIEMPGTNKGGIGLWQHTGSRRRQLEAFAASMKRPWSDAETQMVFTAQELTGPYAHAWHAITALAKTLQSKTETAMGLFEAPASWKQEIQNPGSTTANLPRRMQGAAWALAAILELKGKHMSDTSGVPAIPPTTQDDPFVKWIIDNRVTTDTIIKKLLVAKGVPGPLVDGVFAILHQIDLQTALGLLQHINIGGLVSDLKQKGVQLPSFSNLLGKLHVGG